MLTNWLLPTVLLGVWIAILFVVIPVVVKLLRTTAKKTHSIFDDIIVNSISAPLILILLALGIKLWIDAVNLPTKVNKYTQITAICIFVFGIILFLDRLFVNWIRVYSKRIEFIKTAGTVLKTIFRVVMLAIIGLIILNSFGISITPLIASLGVASLAIALALQDTLSNLFSGIHILIDKPVSVGNYIKLESGEEGYVTQIGWRSTRIRTLPNNEVIIPNLKLSNTQITNFYSPEPELAVLVDVGVSYDSDLDKVEKVTIDVAKQVLSEIPGGVPGFEPFIRYNTFADSSIKFTVVLRAKEYVARYLIIHEFIKRLRKRYRDEGIVIPFPIRTIEFKSGP
ncbi:MAG: mechanosensitive ion channel family protein [bacterium]|nr:mechanosensitive ion channel family protein [bacterium]